ncbi:MAG: hypothetical protein KF799_02950 [Bdellovibrionales bacterium]|nr:hypothetical protein [Bdellovibrionales bacterium]
MTTELVLLLGIYAFLLLGAFLGDLGPIETFKKSAPRLGARVERNISVGDGFRKSANDNQAVVWLKPEGRQ